MSRPSHSSRFYHPNNNGRGVQTISLLCIFLHSPVTSSLLAPNILLNTLFSNTLSLLSSLNVSDQVSHPYKTTSKIIVLYTRILISVFFDTKLEEKYSAPHYSKHSLISVTLQSVILFNNQWNTGALIHTILVSHISVPHTTEDNASRRHQQPSNCKLARKRKLHFSKIKWISLRIAFCCPLRHSIRKLTPERTTAKEKPHFKLLPWTKFSFQLHMNITGSIIWHYLTHSLP